MMALQQLAQVGADECPALETAGLGRGLGLFIGYRRRCGKCDDGWVVSDREDIDIRALVADPDQVGTAVDGEQIGIFHLPLRSEEHTSELQSLMRISYAVFCLKKKIN